MDINIGDIVSGPYVPGEKGTVIAAQVIGDQTWWDVRGQTGQVVLLNAERITVDESYCKVHDIYSCWFSHDPISPDVPEGYTLNYLWNGVTVKLDVPVCQEHGMEEGCIYCARGYDITQEEVRDITRKMYARAGQPDPWRVGALVDNMVNMTKKEG